MSTREKKATEVPDSALNVNKRKASDRGSRLQTE
jgi:hypothetical protein